MRHGHALQHAGDESWHVIGQELKMHHSFWGWEDNGFSACRVVAYAGAYTFPSGRHSKHTYIIECDGNHYAAVHSTVAGALTDAAVKRRVRKAAPPRLI